MFHLVKHVRNIRVQLKKKDKEFLSVHKTYSGEKNEKKFDK